MVAARRRGKCIGRLISLSHEQVIYTRRQITSGEETIAGMASVLGVHRNTLGELLANEIRSL